MAEDTKQQDIGQPLSGRKDTGESSDRKPTGSDGGLAPRGRKLTLEERRLGQILNDRYKLVELIGKGGMAAVYKAEHLGMDTPVAVKMLLPHIEEDELMVQRFIREAKTSGKVAHPHIVQLMDYGVAEDQSRYLVVEYLDGHSLARVLKDEAPLSVERVLHICTQVCEALEDSHRKKIIHRDLKPSNIMLIENDDDHDYVKVVDFGLAKNNGSGDSQRLTQTGELFGSPIYMSPEQCRGFPLDGRSDIYSLGIILYEALTGKAPLVGDNVVATITKHLHETPAPMKQVRPDLHIPERLEAVIQKTLAKDPNNRYPSMSALKEALLASVPARKAAVGLRNKIATNTAGRILEFFGERGSLAIVLFMVVMCMVVCGSAAIVTRVLTPKLQSFVPSASSTSRSQTSPVKAGPAGHGRTKSAPPPVPSAEPVATPEPSAPPRQNKNTDSNVAKVAKKKKSPRAGERNKIGNQTSKQSKDNVAAGQRRNRKRQSKSDFEDWLDFQSKERKYARPRTWDPPVAGSRQGK